MEDESVAMEVYLINHGECELNLRPDLVAGRCPDAGLTHVGKRQARALAVFLNSQGVRFNAVYSSPLERARATATSVCQQMNFAEEQIQSSDAIVDMSHGHWEGCPRSEVFTPEILSLIDRLRPDFSAPSGESIRQVNFRMVQFINETVLCLPEKLRSDFSSPHPVENHVYQNHSSLHEQDGPSHTPPHWDLLHRHRQMSRKKSGKSRLQFMTGTGNHDSADEFSPRDSNHQSPTHDTAATSSSGIPSIGIFTHAMPIKCLLTGILECSPVMTNKICIQDSSITVIQHSWKTGWQIKRLNDIAHLRLL
uniref:Phosphoglycerate mutase n=1 Tax=Kalanchoe fedtschenkoi TaxID=63787 RepID=A0A7N0UDR2_KALFE